VPERQKFLWISCQQTRAFRNRRHVLSGTETRAFRNRTYKEDNCFNRGSNRARANLASYPRARARERGRLLSPALWCGLTQHPAQRRYVGQQVRPPLSASLQGGPKEWGAPSSRYDTAPPASRQEKGGYAAKPWRSSFRERPVEARRRPLAAFKWVG